MLQLKICKLVSCPKAPGLPQAAGKLPVSCIMYREEEPIWNDSKAGKAFLLPQLFGRLPLMFRSMRDRKRRDGKAPWAPQESGRVPAVQNSQEETLEESTGQHAGIGIQTCTVT